MTNSDRWLEDGFFAFANYCSSNYERGRCCWYVEADGIDLVKSICIPFHIANITVAPSSVSALLYKLTNFTCGGTGDILLWSVQGNSPFDPSNQDREISVTTNNTSVDVWSSVLTIRALPINDGISVACAILTESLTFISRGATLTVEGNIDLCLSVKMLFLLTRCFTCEKCPICF